ncbi:hypothetical protein BDY19DRAFT_579093 [Irpex rosettiformis]|uniref:Uncharacterized protein n=1 Tax=Irpex rosettiformis TaxID=378272 RepID=A0ACB8UD02_9APHY|nr:hypothetical protein BDY19DRAFT_579093 [Irpex rosettiformis]
MPGSHVLLQYGADPWAMRFEDLESRLAFTTSLLEEQPNLLLRLTREQTWSQQHPDIMGPSSSFFYFGPSRSPGHLAYGNSAPQPMINSMRRKRDANTRFFVTQSGKEYKWRLSPTKCECFDGKNAVVAIWELAQRSDPSYARLTLKQAALPIVTELLTAFTLNRISETLKW